MPKERLYGYPNHVLHYGTNIFIYNPLKYVPSGFPIVRNLSRYSLVKSTATASKSLTEQEYTERIFFCNRPVRAKV